MFKKREQIDNEDVSMKKGAGTSSGEDPVEETGKPQTIKSKNTILKGSKLIGDINISCDLELSGEIEGNITSDHNHNVMIKGTCKGNIQTQEGNVEIEGVLQGGNISAGNSVRILGKFDGGEVKAGGKIHVNGEFNGKLEGNEIEIGPDTRGKGELLYREYISVAKGADIECKISRIPVELKLVKNSSEDQNGDIKRPAAYPRQ